jgi:subtilisin family serine protease
VPTLDESVPAVNADKLRTGRPSASGQGVLIGIVDTGLDYDHLDFRYDRDGDGFEESTRILYIWDQTETYAGRSPPGFGYGTEYTRAQIETDIANGCQLERDTDCLVQARDEIGHGTHVTGIAAGDGSAAGSPFIGVAPESDLLFVKTTYFENQIIDAVQYILERARRLGRPVVVNLSLGGHFGPHDGTSAFEQGLAALVGKPGQILVTSAGNEGNDKVHAGCRFFVDCHNAQGLIGNTATYHFVVGSDRRAFINFWYPLTARYTVTLTAPDGVALMTVFTGQLATRRRPHGEITVDNASSGPDPRNGLNPLTILIEGAQSGDAWEISIQIEEEGGRFDGWPGLASMGYFQEGDTLMTISEPGNTAGLITVGAYTTKEKWESIEGRAFQFQDHRQRGELAVFSSHGPTRDGRAKPDLTAPGTAIISSLAAESEFAHNPSYRALIVPDGQHSALQGTSMSAPHVSGAVAIMLQTNPRLTAREALLKLQSTSQGDEFTRICPDLQDPRTQPLRWCWGAGKLEALRSVDTLGLEPAQFGQRPQVKLGPNPATERVTFFYSLPPRNAFGDPAESVELWVYEITGRLVHRRRLEARASRSEWDLADEKGRPLPNGLYVIVLAADGTRSDVHRLIIRRR